MDPLRSASAYARTNSANSAQAMETLQSPQAAAVPHPSGHASQLTTAMLSRQAFEGLNAKELHGTPREKNLAKVAKEAIRGGLTLSSNQTATEIAEFGTHRNQDVLAVKAIKNGADYDVLSVGLRRGSSEPESMVLPRERAASPESSDDELVANFVSRGRSQIIGYPSDRAKTPDEQALSEKQRASDRSKNPEEVNDFKEAISDYVSGGKDDETVGFIAAGLNKFAIGLAPIEGKQIFRGVACYADKLPELADYKSWDVNHNREVSRRLIHSADFAPNTAGNHGLASITTVREIASEFASSRQQTNTVDGIASHQAILSILIDPSNPPKGYALDKNYPFGENNLSLHEIQLSKDNDYQLVGLDIQKSGMSNISILASGNNNQS